MDQTVLPKVNMLSRMTGGLKLLNEQIYGKTAVVKTKKYTNRKGHFIAEPNYLLGGRYIIISQVETRGETAVLLKAKDCFHQFRPVVIKVVHLMYKLAGLQEVQLLRRLKTADPCNLSHTIPFLNAFIFNEHVCLVFPTLDVQPLTRVFAEKALNEKNLEKSLSATRKITRYLLTALAFLKTQNIIHADVKPENILVNEDHELDSVTLIDFGNAMNNSQLDKSMYYDDFELQTLPYRAPEVLFRSHFGTQIDMWSLGCVLYECYTGQVLFNGSNKDDTLQKIITLLGPVPAYLYTQAKCTEHLQSVTVSSGQHKCVALRMMSVNPSLRNYEFASFLSGLLTYDPDHRMTPWEALQHPFMAAEICIPYFLNKFSPQTKLTLKQSDYQYQQKISTNIFKKYPSTFDILQVRTSDPPLTRSPSTSQVTLSITSSALNVDEKYLCVSGVSPRHGPTTSNDKCKQSPSDQSKQVVPTGKYNQAFAEKCQQSPLDQSKQKTSGKYKEPQPGKCKLAPVEKCQHARSESPGPQTPPGIKSLAIDVEITREQSEMMSQSEYSNSLHSYDECDSESASKDSCDETDHVEDYPSHDNSVNHSVSTTPCTQRDLSVHSKVNDEREDVQRVHIKTDISSLHEDAEYRHSFQEKVASWLQDQIDEEVNQLDLSRDAIKNDDSESDVSGHALNLTYSPGASSVMERNPKRKRSHHLKDFGVERPNVVLTPEITRTYSKRTAHIEVKPKTSLHTTNMHSSGQETKIGQNIPHSLPRRKRSSEIFEEGKECWKSRRNATQTLFSNSTLPISREMSNSHLINQGETSKISSSSFRVGGVDAEKLKNSHLNSTFAVDEHSCFEPVNYQFHSLTAQKAMKEKYPRYVNELNETFTKGEPRIHLHCETKQVSAVVKDESNLEDVTMSPSQSRNRLNLLTNLKCSTLKQNESILHETFVNVKCESTSSSCASSKSQNDYADRSIHKVISGGCQSKENNYDGNSHNTPSSKEHSPMRKNDTSFAGCVSDESSTETWVVSNNQQRTAQSPRLLGIGKVNITNNRIGEIHANKTFDHEIAQEISSCKDEACMKENNSITDNFSPRKSLSQSHSSDSKQMNNRLADALDWNVGTNPHDTTLITVSSEASGVVARHTVVKPSQLMQLRRHDINPKPTRSSANTSSCESDAISLRAEEIKNQTHTKVPPEKVVIKNVSHSKITNSPPNICSPQALSGSGLQPIKINNPLTQKVNKSENKFKSKRFRTKSPLNKREKNLNQSFSGHHIHADPEKHRSAVQNKPRRKLVRRALWSKKKQPNTSIAYCAHDRESDRHIPSVKVEKRLLQKVSPMSVNDTDPYEFKDSTLKPKQKQRSLKTKPSNLKGTKKKRHNKRVLPKQNHLQRVMPHELNITTLVARKTEQLKLGINCTTRDTTTQDNVIKNEFCKNSTSQKKCQLPLNSNNNIHGCDLDHCSVPNQSRILCHKDHESFSSHKEKHTNSHSKSVQLAKSPGDSKEKNLNTGQQNQNLKSYSLECKPPGKVSKRKTAKQKSHKNVVIPQTCSNVIKTVSENMHCLESSETTMYKQLCETEMDLFNDIIPNKRKVCTDKTAGTKNKNSLGAFTCDNENSDVDEDGIILLQDT